MKLKDYLALVGITARAFAGSIGRTEGTISKLLAGGVPDSTTMRRILAATGGKVQPNDFFELASAPQDQPREIAAAEAAEEQGEVGDRVEHGERIAAGDRRRQREALP